jgi:hypothetical protein
MGFFDRLGGVAGGLLDVGKGTVGFLIDTVESGTKLATGDVDGAFNTFYRSVQDDLMGSVIGGAFGPEGAVGSIIGGLPEFVRKPGRAIVNPAMEAWDWSIQELVDRPLGTFFTVIDAATQGGVHHLVNFDTWKQSYEINDSRTFGQAIALLAYNIDPFDEEEFNEVRQSDMFNVISGAFDFVQEFADPLALTIGAGTKLARGSTVYGFGDTIIGKGGVLGRSVIEPSKVVTFGKTASKEQLRSRVVTERVDRLVGNKEKLIPANKRIENLFKLMNDVDLETSNRMKLTGVPSTADDFAAIDRRAGVLRENMSRRGSLEMPAEAIAFIARGNTDAARKLNFRIALGDMNALKEAKVAASDAVQILNDNNFFTKIETINNLSKQIARDKTNLGKLDATTTKGKEATQKANVRISERQAELNRLTAEISEQQTTLTSVDWGSVYDFDLALKEAQSVTTTHNASGLLDHKGNPLVRVTDEAHNDFFTMALRQVTGQDALATSLLGGTEIPFGSVERFYRGLDIVTDARIKRMEKTGKEVDAINYTIPSSFGNANTRLGRTIRMTVQRVPQTMIDFFDTIQGNTQWERMLEQAGKIRINGKQIITQEQIQQYVGAWYRISSSGSPTKVTELQDLWKSVVDDRLVPKADKLMLEANLPGHEKGLLAKELAESNRYMKDATNYVEGKSKRKQKQQLSVDDAEKTGLDRTTLLVDGQATSIRMTPSQIQESRVIPRWDLIDDDIRRIKSSDKYQKAKALYDTARALRRGVTKSADKTMQYWRPAVLLTPKWTMRVQLDEALRRAGDLGAVATLGGLMRGVQELHTHYAYKHFDGAGGLTDEFVLRMRTKAEELGAVKKGVDVDNYVQLDRFLKENNVTVDQIVKEIVKDSNAEKRPGATPTIVRGLAGSLLAGPVAGAAYAGYYTWRRSRRINNEAIRQSSGQWASLLQTEARKILAEAVDPKDPNYKAKVALANNMLARAEGIEDAVRSIGFPDDRPPEQMTDIVDGFTRAHMFLEKAGQPNLLIGNAVIRGAFGDDPRHWEMISKRVSATKSQDRIFRGVRADSQKQIQDSLGVDWQRWDILDSRERSVAVRGWNRQMQRYTPINANDYSEFYQLVYGSADEATRIDQLANLFMRNNEIVDGLGLPAEVLSRKEVAVDAARNIVDEYNDVLPPEVFEGLRSKAAAGEIIAWADVQQEMIRWVKKPENKQNFETVVGKKVSDYKKTRTTKKGEEITVEDTRALVEDVSRYIRMSDDGKGLGRMGFARSVAENPSSFNPNTRGFEGALGRTIENIFDNLGSLPADILSRNPYFRAKYDAEVMRRIAPFMDETGNITLSQAQLQKIEVQARQKALGKTRDLLYDLAEETRISEMVTNIMPFYNAWQEVIGRWSSIALENPQYVGKLMNLYTKPWNAEGLGIEEIPAYDQRALAEFEKEKGRIATPEEMEQFETGSSYLVWRLNEKLENVPEILTPGILGATARSNPIKFSKDGLASMLQSTTPGFGPMVTVPIREFALKDPSLEETFGFMFPFGHPEGGTITRMIEGFLPAYQRNLINLATETPTRERQVQYFSQQIYVERKLSGDPIDLTNTEEVNAWINEANQRAKNFFTFRVFTGMAVPTSTTISSPYQPYIEEARRLQVRHGTAEGNVIFLEKYGDEFFELTARMTRLNDGVFASATSEATYEKLKPLVQAYPEIGGWLTESLGGSTTEELMFSQTAYRKQQQEQVSPADPTPRRERKTPFETVADPQIEQGWKAYALLNDAVREVQDERRAAGLPYSLNANDLIWLKEYKKQETLKLAEEFPLWYENFQFFQTSDTIYKTMKGLYGSLGNEEYADLLYARPSTKHIMNYLELRESVQEELVRRESLGGSANLLANSNSDLLLYWEQERDELSGRPEFSAFFDRYLENDMIPKNSFMELQFIRPRAVA